MSKAVQPTRPKARILIVDDHPLVREGLAQLINRQSDMACCGEKGTAAEALQAAAAQPPDVAVMDLQLHDTDGLEFIKAFKAQHPSTSVLVLSQFEETIYAERALRSGAAGYVMKEQAAGEVLQALRTVLAGGVHVSPAMTNHLLRKFLTHQSAEVEASVEKLTDRELHVLQLLGARKGTRDIAAEMRLSVKTVETYREHLKHKLNLRDGAALTQYARQWVESRFAAGNGGGETKAAKPEAAGRLEST